MKNYFNIHKLQVKTIAITVLWMFSVNTISWALPHHSLPNRHIAALQVRTMFAQGRVLLELGFIMAMVLKDCKSAEINAALDESYIAREKEKTILKLTRDPQINKDSIALEIEFLQEGGEKKRVRIILFCRSLDDLYKNPDKIKIEVVQDCKRGDEKVSVAKLQEQTADRKENIDKKVIEENVVYINAEIKDGKREGGQKLAVVKKQQLRKIIKEYPTVIIENFRLKTKGGLKLLVWYWVVLKGYENALVTLDVVDKKLRSVYDENNKQIYPFNTNCVYINATIKNGRRADGELIGSAIDRQGLVKVIKNYPDCIVEKVMLNGVGGLTFNEEVYWYTMKGYEKAPITVKSLKGRAVAVYDKNGKRLYPFKENRVYINAKIKNGKRVGGELVGSTIDKNKLNKLIGQYPDCIVEKVMLNGVGGLKFNGEICWHTMKGYEKAPVTVKSLKGRAVAVYDKNGKRLYPFKENRVYINAKIENGKRVGGEFVGSTIDKKKVNKLIGQYPGCIVESVILNSIGGLKFNNKIYWQRLKGYENAPVTIDSVNGRVVAVYNKEGQQLFLAENGRGLKIFNRLWEEGDIEKLIVLFGLEGTSRILLRFFDCFTPRGLLRNFHIFLGSLPRPTKERILNRKRSPPSLKKIRGVLKSIKIFQIERPKTDQELITDELIKLVYPYLVEDYRFLDILRKEAQDPKTSLFLKKCYQNILQYYITSGDFIPKGIQPTTELKFYQKIGIKFILDKKKVLLADELGLGKTIQALGASVNAYGGKGAKKVLIVCPRISKVNVWERQIAKHLRGEQEVMVINKRKTLDSVGGMKKVEEAKFIIANYELIRGSGGKKLLEKLKSMGIDFMIVDEGHRMRNDIQLTKAVNQFDVPYKVLVTGTPLVGRDPARLFNLFHWLYPERYPDRKAFKKVYKKEDGYRQLKDEMKDFTIRRYMSDVLIDMPELNIELRPVRMSKIQTDLYRFIEKNVYQDPPVPIISQLNLLKRASVDTSLVRDIQFINIETDTVKQLNPGAHDIVIDGTKYSIVQGKDDKFSLIFETKSGRKTKKNAQYGNTLTLGGKKYKVNIKTRPSHSAKYDTLDTIVDDVVGNRKEKLVIFTGIVKTVKDLKERYQKKGYEVMSMYGDIASRQREQLITGFNESKKPIIFICTYQTGGESIELTGAHYGVLVDEPWTVQERAQIIRRLYRLGQTEEVKFYILQAQKTIDEGIEEVLMEGDLVQKVILDDPKWIYDSQSEIVRKFLDERAGEEKDLFILKQLQKRTKIQRSVLDKTKPVPLVFQDIKEGPLYVEFRDKVFKTKLQLQSKQMVNINTIKELLAYSGKLSCTSKALLRKFFIWRFTSERQVATKVKDMLFWHVCEELIPGFKDIDYHGRLELMTEIGTYILRRIMEGPKIDKESIFNELGDLPEKLFEETMYYLDSSGIFKFFSLIGVIPQKYYYKGKLLQYSPPIKIYYAREGINYFDEEIVNNIAPGRRIPESDIPQVITGFQRDMQAVRKLDRSEEMLLARQLELRNTAAETVLVSAHLRDIMPVARNVKKQMYIRFGPSLANAVELDEICDIGREILVNLVNTYARFGAYERQPFKDYLRKRLNPRMHSWGYKRIKEISGLIAEVGFYDRDKSYKLVQKDEEEETIEVVQRLLKKAEFNDVEIQVIELFVYEGYTEDQLLEWGKEECDVVYNEDDIKKIIDRFQNLILNMGKERFIELLESGIEEEEHSETDFSHDMNSKEPVKEEKKSQTNKKIKLISDKSLKVFSRIKPELIKTLDKSITEGKQIPIDIVVDLSLISKEELEVCRNIKTWAYLILLSKDIKNVNFIFTDKPELAEGEKLPNCLQKEIVNAPDRKLVLKLLKKEVKFFNDDTDLKSLINDRIRGPRSTEEKKVIKPIEIPIISRELAEWASYNNVKLKHNQYPIVMAGLTSDDGSRIPLRNFEAAFIIGMGKAALAIAKSKVEKGEKGAEESFLKLRKDLFIKLSSLYNVIRKDENPVVLTEKILEYMVDKKSAHRLNRAIDFYIPPVTRMPVKQLRSFHERIQKFL